MSFDDTLSPIEESPEIEVEVEIHPPPKKREIEKHNFDKQLRVVLTPFTTKQEKSKNKKRVTNTNQRKLVRRNLEQELQTFSSIESSNNNIENMDFVCSAGDKGSGTNVFGTDTLIEDANLRSLSFQRPADEKQRYVCYIFCDFQTIRYL